MANIGSAYLSIYPSMDGFGSKLMSELNGVDVSSIGDKLGDQLGDGIADGLDNASKSATGFSGKLSSLSGAVMGVASEIAGRLLDAVMDLGSEMVESADSAQKFASTLSFAGIDTSTIDALTASTQKYADETVYDLTTVRNVTAQLAANGVSDYAKLTEAAGNLNAVAGGNADTFQSVGMVLTQTAGAGKLLTENWNQLTDAIPGASGALQDAMREAGAFEGNFREAMENGEISADEFFQAVQKLGMQDVAVEAATSTSTIEGAMGNLQASVVGVGSGIISALTPAITGAMSAISDFISGIPTALAPVGAAIQTALSGGGTEGIAMAISTLITTIGTNLTVGLQTLAAQLPVMMQTILPIVVAGLTSFATSVVMQLPTILMSLLELAVSGISSFVSIIAAQLPTVLPVLAEALSTAVNDLVNQVLTELPSYLDQMVSAALDLLDGIVQAIPQTIPKVVQGIGDLVRTVLRNLPSFLGQMLSAAVQLFNGIVQAIPQVVPAVLSGIGDLLGDIFDAITSFDLADAGVQLIKGFAGGISSMAQSVINAVGDVVGGAIDWAKSLLGIASPSKVFAEIGGYTMEGMEVGLEKAYGGVRDGLRSMMAGLVDVAGGGAMGVESALGGIGSLGASVDVRSTAYAPLAAQPSGGTTNVYLDGARLQQSPDVMDAVLALVDALNRDFDMGV